MGSSHYQRRKAIFNPSSNPVFENAEAKLFGKKERSCWPYGAMINWIEVKEQGKTKVRRHDTIDDIEVSRFSSMPHMIGESKTA